VQKLLLCCYVSSSSGGGAAPALVTGLADMVVTPCYVWGPRQFATNEDFRSVVDCQRRYRGGGGGIGGGPAAVGRHPRPAPPVAAQTAISSADGGFTLAPKRSLEESLCAGDTGSCSTAGGVRVSEGSQLPKRGKECS
jgi:hypothetical protein